ncbi:relaxase/mobilization nuclease domain-containing protein [uncultured Croceitalea sp.]|uniref:relaxase/mobilization nuclease domain-containing protein n=1 Tax=uncultured Croceitalea sp. TaxID=1798908 RepID=UPI00330585CE
MIGKGKSISHTGASMGYGWNQEKNAEVVYKQHLAGDNPREITEEFRIIQEQNIRTKNNTLSFVLSPTIEDGTSLSSERLQELTQRFITEMKLEEHQGIGFVHRDKQHTHVHVYVNRVNFDGTAYKDNFIGKRSQYAAEKVAKEMGLTTAREVQQEKLSELKRIRREIKQTHEKVMTEKRPKDFDQYIKYMKQNRIKVIPSINRQNQLQGFRFEYKGQNLKGSEVHRSMSGSKLAIQIGDNSRKGILKKGNTITLLGRTLGLSTNLATSIAKRVLKKVIKRTLDRGIGI